MSEAIQFYAPDWELVLIWCAIAIPTGLAVFWMGRLFGGIGALVASAVIGAAALAMLVLPTTGSHGPTYFMILSVPLSAGALLGLVVWYVCRATFDERARCSRFPPARRGFL